MLNKIRNLLLNIPASEQPDSQFSELIVESYSTFEPDLVLERLRNALIPAELTEEERLQYAYQYVKLLYSTEFQSFLKPINDTLSFPLDSNKFIGISFSLTDTETRIRNISSTIDEFWNVLVSARLDANSRGTLRFVYENHPNLIYRLAALVTAYVLVLSSFYDNKKINLTDLANV